MLERERERKDDDVGSPTEDCMVDTINRTV